MRHFSLFLLLIFYSCVLRAQQPADSNGYIGYFREISFAEAAVIRGNYPAALATYDQTFRHYPWQQPADCYIAAQVAAYAGDTVACLSFIRRGLCVGLSPETINAHPLLQAVFPMLASYVADSCRQVYLSRIQPDARAAIVRLARADRQLVASLPPMGLYGRDGATLKQEWQPFYDSLLRELVRITEQYGFPAERIAGTPAPEDSVFATSVHNRYAYYILIHHGNAWQQIGTLLGRELRRGNITPQMYAAIREHSNGTYAAADTIHYYALRPCQSKACEKALRQAGVERINRDRWQAGLGSYELMQRKYESMLRYRKWRSSAARRPEPVFDFCCELHFGN